MKKNTIKNTVLVGLFIILAPLILVGVTALGNSLGGKAKIKLFKQLNKLLKFQRRQKLKVIKIYLKANDSKVTEESTTKKKHQLMDQKIVNLKE